MWMERLKIGLMFLGGLYLLIGLVFLAGTLAAIFGGINEGDGNEDDDEIADPPAPPADAVRSVPRARSLSAFRAGSDHAALCGVRPHEHRLVDRLARRKAEAFILGAPLDLDARSADRLKQSA